MRIHAICTALVMLALAACAAPVPKAEDHPIRVVYHVSEDADQAYRALNNIANQLRVDPTAEIVVVAYGHGLEFLKRDARAADGGQPFAAVVKPLQARGVEFRVCRNSMNALRLDAGDMIDGVAIVPSGVAEIVSLQARRDFAYIRP